MFELLVGFFLLGTLNLAFRENSEGEESTFDPAAAILEELGVSVYEHTPIAVIEEEIVGVSANSDEIEPAFLRPPSDRICANSGMSSFE